MKERDQDGLGWLPHDSAMPNLIELWRQQQRDQQMRAILSGSAQVSAALSVNVADSVHVSDGGTTEAQPQAVDASPDVLIQAAVVRFGDHTADGQIISGVSVPWFEIISQLAADPDFLLSHGENSKKSSPEPTNAMVGRLS